MGWFFRFRLRTNYWHLEKLITRRITMYLQTLVRAISIATLVLALNACTALTLAGSAVMDAGSAVVTGAAKAGSSVVDAITPDSKK